MNFSVLAPPDAELLTSEVVEALLEAGFDERCIVWHWTNTGSDAFGYPSREFKDEPYLLSPWGELSHREFYQVCSGLFYDSLVEGSEQWDPMKSSYGSQQIIDQGLALSFPASVLKVWMDGPAAAQARLALSALAGAGDVAPLGGWLG